MSRTRTVSFTCPSCGKESDMTIWESINTVMDPEMKAAVRDGSAFTFTCPHCGVKTHLEYGFLYHQMEDRMMIQYASSDENAEEMYRFFTGVVPSDVFTEFRKGEYLIRIVRSLNQLREKLAIFDHGLDDRIIELCKQFALMQYQKDRGDSGKDTELLYFYYEGKHHIQIFDDHEPVGTVEITQDFYNTVRNEFEVNLPEIRKDDIVIDTQWALACLQHHSERNRS